MSSSIICQNFVQNAWKKELCSNCFKSQDEHRKSPTGAISASSAIAAMLKSTANASNNANNNKNKFFNNTQNNHNTQSNLTSNVATMNKTNDNKTQNKVETNISNSTTDGRCTNNIEQEKTPKSIIKTQNTAKQTKSTKRTVNFKVKLAQVIGFGGEDWSEEEEDVVAYEENIEEDKPTEEEKELHRLTKLNTDFNTNLTCKKLQLGKPLMDADGKKKTLMVQVTPFGQERNSEKTKVNITKFLSNSSLNKDKNKKQELNDESNNNEKFKDIEEVNVSSLNDTKLITFDENNVKESPKEKSLLDEITQELEKSKISVNPKKIVTKEIILQAPPMNTTIATQIVATPKSVKTGPVTKLSRNPAIKETKKTYQSSKSLNLIIDKNIEMKKEDKNYEDKDSANGGSSLDDSSSHCGSEDSASDSSLEAVKTLCYDNAKIPSRELVGEPDGRAESDGTDEPIPALPMSQPPSNCMQPNVQLQKQNNLQNQQNNLQNQQNQFQNQQNNQQNQQNNLQNQQNNLQNQQNNLKIQQNQLQTQQNQQKQEQNKIESEKKLQSPEKPKIPTKPSTILIRKPPSIMAVNQVILSTFNSDKTKLKPATLTTSVAAPPPTPSMTNQINYVHSPIQKRDSNGSDISKKRKAPKPPQEEQTATMYMRNKPLNITNTDCPVVREKEKRERASSCTPKSINMSLGNLTIGGATCNGPEPAPRRSLSLSTDSLASNGSDEKKKRGKFSLKKLLRMGGANVGGSKSKEEEKPLPKPRLVIVHPLDMQEKQTAEQEYVNTSFLKEQIQLENQAARPPPPPRNYENYEKPSVGPKTTQVKSLMAQNAGGNLKKPSDSVYANIGEVRNAITPNKPQRTASMREVKDGAVVVAQSRNAYEPVVTSGGELPKQAQKLQEMKDKQDEHVYDYIGHRSSSPECDSKNKMAAVTANSGQMQNGGMSRSVSMTYCGSETESEIYSPYSYYGSESEVAEDEQECCYGNGLGSTGRTHKLRSKKGRSIVHKNLEDNYGAVVVANHEALAQVLENIQQMIHIPLPLRALKTTENLRLVDFTLRPSTANQQPPTTIGNCSFHQATWNLQNVTLMISIIPNSPSCSLGSLLLQPVTEFSDLVSPSILHQQQQQQQQQQHTAPPIQATISVLPHLQINSIATIGDQLKTNKSMDSIEMHKASTVLLLQLVNSLKTLQAQGVEELPLNLNSFVLAKDVEKQEMHSRLYILHPNDEARQDLGTLCIVVSKAMDLLPMDGWLQKLIQSLLTTERAVTLSQVKSVLEFSLWGPSDVALGSTPSEREFVLQRWLDLQRATVLHGLVCAKVQLTVYEECHLLFLVRSNAKMMCDASLLLESVRCK